VLPLGTIRKIGILVSLGELGKGAAALIKATAAPFCEATFRMLEALHPLAPADRPIPASVLNADPAPAVVSRDVLVVVLQRLRRGVASGVSGLSNDHLRTLFPTRTDADKAALDPLLAFVNCVLTGKIGKTTTDWLLASKLVALLKPDGEGGFKMKNGLLDLRPIAMPETLYRLVALCALAAEKLAITEVLTKVQQLCVGVPSACEGIASAVRLYLDELEMPSAEDAPGGMPRALAGLYADVAAGERLVMKMRCVLSTDATNAFNTVSRAAVMEAVLKFVPSLLPFVRMSYGGESRLVFANNDRSGADGEELSHTFWSRTGVRQGDPLGPVLFALAIVAVLEEVQAKHPDVDVFAFADDGITLIEATSRPALVTKTKAVFDDLVVAFRKVNVELNTKTKVLCYHDAAVGLDAGASGVDILNVLGVPTSADHKAVAAVALKRLKDSFEQLTLLPQLPFGDAMTLLRKCISTRADYLFGQLPEEAARIVAAVWDPAVERCLVAMFKGSYGTRVHLMGPGGLGVARRGVTRHLDRVSGFARASEAIDKYLPRQRDRAQVTAASRNPVHQEVCTVYAALPPEARATEGVYNPLSPLPTLAPPAQPSSRNRSPSSATPPSTMKAAVDNLRAAVQKVQQAELLDQLTPFGRLALERAAQPGARCWADAPPRFSYRQMESEEWRVAFCLWLGMAVPQLASWTP